MPVFAAQGGWVSWSVMLFLYGLVFLAILVNRHEQKQHASDGGPSLPWETFWDRGLSDVRWWQVAGITLALVSAAYGVGVVVFAQLNPELGLKVQNAPFAIVNAICMFLALTLATPPPRPRSQELPQDGSPGLRDPSVGLRTLKPDNFAPWDPEKAPISEEIQEYEADGRLRIQRPEGEPLGPQTSIATSDLFLTLVLSSLVAPILSGIGVGFLFLMRNLDRSLFIPLFAWVTAGLTLLLALASYFAMRKIAARENSRFAFSQFLFDFEEKNLYMEGPRGVQSMHFEQCQALILSQVEGEDQQPLGLQLHILGDDLPEGGLLLLELPFASEDTSDARIHGQRFAAMLAQSTDIPLYATPSVSAL